MNTIFRFLLLIAVVAFAACSSANEEAQTTATPAPPASLPTVSVDDLTVVKGQTVYVPTYSNIFFTDSEKTWDLAVTLAIHNIDPTNPIIITSARFYDTDGNPVTDYVPQPVELGPLGTANLVLERTDTRGGVGANFIVDWSADQAVSEPVIETVMVTTAGTQGLGFTSPGRVISEE